MKECICASGAQTTVIYVHCVIEGHNRNNSNLFGGLIYASDYEIDYEPRDNENSGSYFANRIASDWRFDKQCKKNIELRERQKTYVPRSTRNISTRSKGDMYDSDNVDYTDNSTNSDYVDYANNSDILLEV